MTPRYPAWILAATIVASGLSAAAHDTGFGHSRRGVFFSVDGEDRLRIEYRVRLEPDEALIELARMDVDADGAVSREERDGYLNRRGAALAARVSIESGGAKRPARLVGASLGHSFVQVYRFEVEGFRDEAQFEDRNFPQRPGHMRLDAAAGLVVRVVGGADLTHADRVRARIMRTAAPERK